MDGLIKFSQWVGKTFAIWALLSAVLGFLFPEIFSQFGKFIVPILGIIMFGMGMTLKAEDFLEIAKRPKLVLVGILAQFTIMPLVALALTKIFNLDPYLALGVILVGCCPGGTSSNVITYLAKGDVALSIAVTSVTTILAPILTPLLLKLLAGELIDVAVGSMMLSIFKMVILPIILGIIFNKLLGKKVETALNILPMVSVIGIAIIIAAVIAASKNSILTSGFLIFLIVALHNLIGYALGYLTARACGFNKMQRRAIMIEVGMQNSGLGAALAASYFNPVASLPSAIFSVWHNFSGALVANACSRTDALTHQTDNV